MNAMCVIFPYKHQGQWVFDDDAAGLVREPFVLGIDTMLDKATVGIPNAHKGFTLFFSSTPFPKFTVKLEWRRTEFGGNWYWCEQYGIEGYLCPALFKYFEVAPKEIYARAEPKDPAI